MLRFIPRHTYVERIPNGTKVLVVMAPESVLSCTVLQTLPSRCTDCGGRAYLVQTSEMQRLEACSDVLRFSC